jgi:hypothetical protein
MRSTGQPMKRQAPRARAFDRDPIRGEHYGQRPWSVPHPKAGHMAAPISNVQKVDNTPAKPEPSTHGSSETRSLGSDTAKES